MESKDAENIHSRSDYPSTPLSCAGTGLRLDPRSFSSQNIEIDWIRLVEFDAALNRTISWSGASGPVDIYLDDDQSSANGNLGQIANQVTGGSHTFNLGCLSYGTYYVAITDDGGSSFAYSNGAYVVNDTPTLRFTSPSEEGSSDDFATTHLGNPWDMDSLNDVDLFLHVDNLAAPTPAVSLPSVDRRSRSSLRPEPRASAAPRLRHRDAAQKVETMSVHRTAYALVDILPGLRL